MSSLYDITGYTKGKAKELQLEIKPSTRKGKKIDVFKNGELIASIGAKGYGDYSHYLLERGKEYADERKRLYRIRHKNDDSLEGLLSKFLLW